MKKATILLRISYWSGAIFDAIMVVPMLFPKIGGLIFGIDDFNPGNDYRYAMMVGASLMLGWTFLLIWADRKPLERKGILLLTIFPVIIGIVLSSVFAVNVGLIKVENMIPTWILQFIIFALFSYSYYIASKAQQGQKKIETHKSK